MSTNKPTVFAVDDDASFLKSLVRLLQASGYSVETAVSAEQFLAQRPPEAHGCVLADLRMPGMSGIELQDALAKSGTPLPVVFLTGHGDVPTSVKAMRHGAEDFLMKTAPKKDLIAAVERALARDARDREARLRQRELHGWFDKLTPRESEVLSHVLAGQLNKQIAADLGIDERSVKRHRTSFMGKIGVQSVAELAQLAAEAGIRGI